MEISRVRAASLGSIVAACAFPVLYLLLGRVNGWDLKGAQLPLDVFAFGPFDAGIAHHAREATALLHGRRPQPAGRQHPGFEDPLGLGLGAGDDEVLVDHWR